MKWVWTCGSEGSCLVLWHKCRTFSEVKTLLKLIHHRLASEKHEPALWSDPVRAQTLTPERRWGKASREPLAPDIDQPCLKWSSSVKRNGKNSSLWMLCKSDPRLPKVPLWNYCKTRVSTLFQENCIKRGKKKVLSHGQESLLLSDSPTLNLLSCRTFLMATISWVSMSRAWYTTPNDPLPITYEEVKTPR